MGICVVKMVAFHLLDDDLSNVDEVALLTCMTVKSGGGGGSRDSRCMESRLRDRRATCCEAHRF